jgi:hypothetical protein
MGDPIRASPELAAAVAHLFPRARILGCDPIGADHPPPSAEKSTEKAGGYAAPVRWTIQTALGETAASCSAPRRPTSSAMTAAPTAPPSSSWH